MSKSFKALDGGLSIEGGYEKLRFNPGESLGSLLAELKAFFRQRSIEAYLVGGGVRDCLLNRMTSDVDLAVQGDALTLGRQLADALGGHYFTLDETNHIARVVFPRDAAPDKEWHIDLSSFEGEILSDLERRDFTINALAIRLEDAEDQEVQTLDPFRGLQDLKDGIIRGSHPDVFQRDPVRLLRAFRLARDLSFTIEEATLALIRRDAPLIRQAASERVRVELCSLLASPGAADILRTLDQHHLLLSLIPELREAKGVQQPKEHFWDVYEHSIETVAALEGVLRQSCDGPYDKAELIPWSAELEEHFRQRMNGGYSRIVLVKLGALFHDIAKPQMKTIDQNGRIRFFGHAEKGAEITEGIMKRLRFSGQEVRAVSKMVNYHLRPGLISLGPELPTRRAIYRYFRDAAEVGIDTLFLNMADYLAARGPLLGSDEWRQYMEGICYILSMRLEEEKVIAPPKLVDGHDLMKRFALSPGPLLGKLLEAVREAQAAGVVSSKADAIKFVDKMLRSEAKGRHG